jgi:hypothetical protein
VLVLFSGPSNATLCGNPPGDELRRIGLYRVAQGHRLIEDGVVKDGPLVVREAGDGATRDEILGPRDFQGSLRGVRDDESLTFDSGSPNVTR